MNSAERHKALSKPFPREKIQEKRGQGGRMMSYISHGLITERLNEVDPEWSWDRVEEHIYYDNGIPHCAGVTVRLTVGGIARVEAGGPQRQDGFANEIKNAYSDALKRAAMRFGVALDMWESLVDAEYDEDVTLAERVPAPVQRQAQPQRQQQPQPTSTVQSVPAPASERVAGGATKKQIGKLRVQASQAGHNDDNLHGQLWARYRLEHLDQLDSKRASDLIDRYIKLDFIDVPADNPRQVQRHDPVQARASGMDVPEEPAYLREAPGQDSWTR
jgi:hypothetical protein